MRSVILKESGTEITLKVKSKWNRKFFGVERIEQSWSTPENRCFKTTGQLDRESELIFERWAGNLDVMLCLDMGEEPQKSVYEWGKELARLEMTAMQPDDYRIVRMYRIGRMLIDAGVIWRNGPSWWREL